MKDLMEKKTQSMVYKPKERKLMENDDESAMGDIVQLRKKLEGKDTNQHTNTSTITGGCDTSEGIAFQINPNIQDAPNMGSAKSHLYEICVANHWTPPVFECCKEEGQSHMRVFTFKVTINIPAPTNTFLECFGAPQSKKKTAAEHAAEGALWYLKKSGYHPNKK